MLQNVTRNVYDINIAIALVKMGNKWYNNFTINPKALLV